MSAVQLYSPFNREILRYLIQLRVGNCQTRQFLNDGCNSVSAQWQVHFVWTVVYTRGGVMLSAEEAIADFTARRFSKWILRGTS